MISSIAIDLRSIICTGAVRNGMRSTIISKRVNETIKSLTAMSIPVSALLEGSLLSFVYASVPIVEKPLLGNALLQKIRDMAGGGRS